jgi:hypothetical protein
VSGTTLRNSKAINRPQDNAIAYCVSGNKPSLQVTCCCRAAVFILHTITCLKHAVGSGCIPATVCLHIFHAGVKKPISRPLEVGIVLTIHTQARSTLSAGQSRLSPKPLSASGLIQTVLRCLENLPLRTTTIPANGKTIMASTSCAREHNAKAEPG